MIEVLHKKSPRCPPYNYLAQVSQYYPKALFTYLFLWRTMDEKNKLTLYKKDFFSEYLISLAKFRHDVHLLVREGLVSLDETPNVMHLEMVGWEDE